MLTLLMLLMVCEGPVIRRSFRCHFARQSAPRGSHQSFLGSFLCCYERQRPCHTGRSF